MSGTQKKFGTFHRLDETTLRAVHIIMAIAVLIKCSTIAPEVYCGGYKSERKTRDLCKEYTRMVLLAMYISLYRTAPILH